MEKSHDLATYPLPGGDLDGDGVPDVVVSQRLSIERKAGPPATLPLQVFSGRSGRRLWSAGPLPLGFEAHGFSQIEGIDVRRYHEQGPPDVLVLHVSPFADPGEVEPPSSRAYQVRLVRLSGRDGRVVWDAPLSERLGVQGNFTSLGKGPLEFADLNGDGHLDVVLAIPMKARANGTIAFGLRAVSLADGKPLWAHPIRRSHGGAIFAVGDLDSDGRSEVVVGDSPPEGIKAGIEVATLAGRDGSIRWTWRGGDASENGYNVSLALVDFAGKGRRAVCLKGRQRLRILDAPGRKHRSRRRVDVGHRQRPR